MSRKYTTLPYTEYPVAIGNFDKTRKTIDRIVLHHTNGTFQSAVNWFGNPKAGTSAHYVVGNDGKVAAMLEEYYTAFHCGNYATNQRSIGIETEWFEGMTRTETLYKKVVDLVADICKYYNIPADRTHILKHSEIKATACPGSLDVERIVRDVKAKLSGGSSTGTITIDKSLYEKLVGGSTVRKEVAENLGVADADNASSKAMIAVIDDLREQNKSLTKDKTKLSTKVEVITADNDKLNEQLQQNSTLDSQLLEMKEANDTLQEKLEEFAGASDGLISQTTHDEEMTKLEKRLKQQFTRDIDVRVKEKIVTLSFRELLKVFVQRIIHKYGHTNTNTS